MTKYTKGEYNKWHQEIWEDGDNYVGDVRVEHSDTFVKLLNDLHEENQQLKSDLARTIEQAHKNNKLLVSDIRTLEKALWCPECTNNMKRLKELRKEFLE